jgi:hypothetical protein
VALKSCFLDLVNRLERLLATLEELLRWAVTEGKPEAEDHVLVTRLDDATSDLIGLLEEAKAAAKLGLEAVTSQIDWTGARQALITCQQQVNSASRHFFSDMVSFDAMKALDSLAAERKKHWPQWVTGVRDALDRCSQPINDVSDSLFECWQELTDRTGSISVSVQAISTGQQINVPHRAAGKRR